MAAAFSQQRIPAWQPVVKPGYVLLSLGILSAVCLALGTALILVSNSAIECYVKYSGPTSGLESSKFNIVLGKDNCKGAHVSTTGKLRQPVYLYYVLDGFYQNHRRYLLSRSTDQLHGEIIVDKSKISDCEPLVLSDDGYRIRTPCGLAAAAVFNDTFSVPDYTMSESAEDLVWSAESQFKNPEDDGSPAYKLLDQWLPKEVFPKQMEDPHFEVWMRNAALPKFRKLYGVIKEDVYLPVTIEVTNRYPVESFSAKKYILLTEMTWVGGRNPFIGITFCVVGAILFCFLLFVVIKNRRKPRYDSDSNVLFFCRVMGDVRFLKWRKQG